MYASQSKGYGTLADNLRSLADLDSLPLPIKISCLDNGTGTEETLMPQNVKQHKFAMSCNKTKVDRFRKKIAKEQARSNKD